VSGSAMFPTSGQSDLARLPQELLRGRVFNWRVIFARLVVYGLALGLSSLILPGFEIRPVYGQQIYSVIILAAIYGVVIAVVKPVFQFLALPFIIETSGFVVIAINIVIFALFDAFAGSLTDIKGVGWLFLGGILVWLLAFLFENLLGIPPPIISDIPPEEEGAGAAT
jgi:putative membrane protein